MESPTDNHSLKQNRGYRTLVENFPNGVLVLFDSDLVYRIIGPETLPFSGRAAADMVDRSLFDLFPEETATLLEPELRATIAGDARSVDVEYGEHVHHIETEPVQIDGDPYGILVTQEVTDERETAEELQRQNERLDQFASMVSHDLRNPLSLAFGKIAMFRETGDESMIEDVEDALTRIDELTEDLLTLAKADHSSTESNPVSLADIALKAWGMIDTRSARLVTDEDTITGDASQLQALFENLFRNAVGHGGPDVTVRVGSLADGFYVEDTGKGFPSDEREQVLDHGFSTGYGGNGVGLTIVRHIAESNDWEISLAESNEGGARVEFHDT